MARLVFVDARGGALAVLAAALAQHANKSGGFDAIVATTTTAPRATDVVAAVLREIGIDDVPALASATAGDGDTVVNVGATAGDGAWDVELAEDDAATLVQSALARTARDRLAARIRTSLPLG